jgi:hypothetical protein
MPKREHQIPPGEGGPAAGSFGSRFDVQRLTLSADQIDHLHEEAEWQSRGWPGIPWRMLAVILGGVALIIAAFIVLTVVWAYLV